MRTREFELALILALGALTACTAAGEPIVAPARDASVGSDGAMDASKPDAAVTDALVDMSVDATVDGDADTEDTLDTGPIIPKPIEDTGMAADVGPPGPGQRIEGLIGPAGGTLAGADGTPLRGVRFVVPPGALSTDVYFAVDIQPTPFPPVATSTISPYVAVGPDGVVFAIPARLTLPWTTTAASPQLAMGARIGTQWSGLLEPTGDVTARTLTASMKRTSGAAVVLVDLSMAVPTITALSPTNAPAGTLVFVEGTKLGFAPVFRPADDAGVDFTSTVRVSGVAVTPLAWDDTTISFRAPAGDGGLVTVRTPGGVGTSPSPLTP